MTSKMTLLAVALTLAPAMAFAAGDHVGGHGSPMGEAAKGKPTQTVTITMRETDDGEMIFEPGDLSFAPGETVRLHIINAGENEHEFVMDTPESIQEHKELMAKFPEMEHDEPNAVRLQPGEEGEILWTFGATGTFEYACLLLGHYESGMHGPLVVN